MIRIDLTLVLTAINFGILYWCLRKFLFLPVSSVLEERKKRIEEYMNASGEKMEKSENFKIQYLELLKNGKKEADQSLEQLEETAWMERMEKLQEIQNIHLQKIEGAKIVLQAEKDQVRARLKNKIPVFAAQITGKILSEDTSIDVK